MCVWNYNSLVEWQTSERPNRERESADDDVWRAESSGIKSRVPKTRVFVHPLILSHIQSNAQSNHIFSATWQCFKNIHLLVVGGGFSFIGCDLIFRCVASLTWHWHYIFKARRPNWQLEIYDNCERERDSERMMQEWNVQKLVSHCLPCNWGEKLCRDN